MIAYFKWADDVTSDHVDFLFPLCVTLVLPWEPSHYGTDPTQFAAWFGTIPTEFRPLVETLVVTR